MQHVLLRHHEVFLQAALERIQQAPVVEHFDLGTVRVPRYQGYGCAQRCALDLCERVTTQQHMALHHLEEVHCGLPTVGLPAQQVKQGVVTQHVAPARITWAPTIQLAGQGAYGAGQEIDSTPYRRQL